jgi:hypothetical protein
LGCLSGVDELLEEGERDEFDLTPIVLIEKEIGEENELHPARFYT